MIDPDTLKMVSKRYSNLKIPNEVAELEFEVGVFAGGKDMTVTKESTMGIEIERKWVVDVSFPP